MRAAPPKYATKVSVMDTRTAVQLLSLYGWPPSSKATTHTYYHVLSRLDEGDDALAARPATQVRVWARLTSGWQNASLYRLVLHVLEWGASPEDLARRAEPWNPNPPA